VFFILARDPSTPSKGGARVGIVQAPRGKSPHEAKVGIF